MGLLFSLHFRGFDSELESKDHPWLIEEADNLMKEREMLYHFDDDEDDKLQVGAADAKAKAKVSERSERASLEEDEHTYSR